MARNQNRSRARRPFGKYIALLLGLIGKINQKIWQWLTECRHVLCHMEILSSRRADQYEYWCQAMSGNMHRQQLWEYWRDPGRPRHSGEPCRMLYTTHDSRQPELCHGLSDEWELDMAPMRSRGLGLECLSAVSLRATWVLHGYWFSNLRWTTSNARNTHHHLEHR